MRRHLSLLLAAAALAACSSDPGSISTGGTDAATAAAIRCPAGYTRKGNRCLINPTPTPTPTPTPSPTPTPTPTPTPSPPPTQTCWDGSIIPASSVCPVQPPPPPPPVQCPDGTSVPAGQTCPLPPPPPPPSPPPSGAWVAAAIAPGGLAQVLAAEQAVPKTSTYPYGEAVYRTVLAGEIVQLGASYPDFSCACAGQPREWAVYGLDGKFIGYLWDSNLSGVAPAPAPPPPPANTWATAPLQDGGFARVVVDDNLWDMTGPGQGRALVTGEIVAVYYQGSGVQADGQASYAIYALADGTSGRALASDLQGVVPVGSPPGLPANWWVPGLVTANKTCTDPRQGHEGQPGVTQGGIYRAEMLVGSHMSLAIGQIGSAAQTWEVFGAGDMNAPATVTAAFVTGDCLTGS